MAVTAASARGRGLVVRAQRWGGLPYWLTLPTAAYLVLFFAWPMVQSFVLAFQANGSWSLENYRVMASDTRFWDAVSFTLLLIALIVPIQLCLALTIAMLLNARLKGTDIFLYIFMLPLAISDLAAGIAWSGVFTQQGYLNTVLQTLGLMHIPYIWIDPQHPWLIVLAVVIEELWRSTPLVMVILYAGLQGIQRDYLEAAEIFGAGFVQRLRWVVLPMLKPAIQVALVLRVVLAFEVFSTVIAITGSSATVLAEEAWRWQVTYFDPGVAAAYASLILVVSLVSAGVVFLVLRTPREQVAR